jgi:CubicO group peptidase (beta-lactamase class C family)
MKRKIALLSAVLWLLTAALAQAQSLAPAKPEQVGLSSDRIGRIVSMLRADSEAGKIPGAILLVARQGKVVAFETAGVLDPKTKAPMTKDAIFRIYSMSKPITSVAVMMLVEDGKIALSDPASKYIPQIAEMKVGVEKPGPDGKPVLELVLTYGIFGDALVKKQWREAKLFEGDPTNAEFVDRMAKLPLNSQPGSTWDYSHSTDVLGRIVEVVSKKSLYEFEKERILDPLGMKDTAFDVRDKSKQARIAEAFPNDVTIGAGTTFFDPRVAQKWESGGGGMVGTTMDYARFCQMVLNGGTLDGKRLLSPKTVAFMSADHLDASISHGPLYLPGPGFGFGLGFAVRNTAGVAPALGSAGELNWGGAGGTAFWIDPKEDLFVVFMMQSPGQRVYYRPVIRNMIYSAIVKPNGR